MKVDTWMPIYWGDYAKDTGHLGAVHHGAYLMLIKHYWTQGEPLPADDDQLFRIACVDSIAHWRKIKPVVLAFFEEREGRLHHDRIEKELANAEGNAERRAESARRAAEARWEQERARGNAPRNARGMPKAMRGECPPPSSSDESHGDIQTDAVGAAASPDGPPRPRLQQLPDSALWAGRLAEYEPWNGKYRWPWGPPPDAVGRRNPSLSDEQIRAWKARRDEAAKQKEVVA